MAILVSVKVKGQTQQGYDSVLNLVMEPVKKAPGFAVTQRMPRQCLSCATPLVGGLHVDLLSPNDGRARIIPWKTTVE